MIVALRRSAQQHKLRVVEFGRHAPCAKTGVAKLLTGFGLARVRRRDTAGRSIAGRVGGA